MVTGKKISELLRIPLRTGIRMSASDKNAGAFPKKDSNTTSLKEKGK